MEVDMVFRMLSGSVAAGLAGFACAAGRSVTNEYDCTTTSASVLTAEATLPVTEAQFLAKLGTPSIWADASDRTLWKIADDGKVTNILDKAGSGRWVQNAKYVGTDYKTLVCFGHFVIQ